MARLDRLGAAKEVAQIGAAIGREFTHEMLAAVARLPEKELQQAAIELVRSGLVFHRGTPPRPIYTFKHALVQDAAYDSLLRSRRCQYRFKFPQMCRSKIPQLVGFGDQPIGW
jgi:predicted ATPase